MRRVSYIKAAEKALRDFPLGAREKVLVALELAARGSFAEISKPMKGLGAGVYEIALPYRGDAYRVVYIVKIYEDVWVVHAFKKKSNQGIATPHKELETIKERLKRLKEQLSHD